MTWYHMNLISKIVLWLITGMVLWSCQEKEGKKVPAVSETEQALWIDETSIYLPSTGEWTNRVEVA